MKEKTNTGRTDMKKVKIIAIALILSLATALCLSGCGQKTLSLTGDLRDIVADVTSQFDFEGVEFIYSDDELAGDILYFSYGFDDISLFEDYVLCQRASGRAASFIIIRFKDGADVDAIKETLQINYVEAMYSLFELYIPEEYDIALGASYKIYDNAIVLAVYDTQGNEGIFSAVDNYAK
jgi:hypothetical protein